MPHNIFPHFHFLRNRELNELYTSIAIRAFAISLIGIFIPIFLYQLNYSFSQIFLFFGLIALFNLIFLFPSAKFASKYGLKHGMLLSIPFLIVFFLLLFSLDDFNWPLTFIAALVATIILAVFIDLAQARTAIEGAMAGVLLWVGVAAVAGMGFIWGDKPKKLFLIDSGYHLVSFLAGGAILAIWV